MSKRLKLVLNPGPEQREILQKGEVRTMKSFLRFLLVLGMIVGVTGLALAINPDTCLLTVTPSAGYSVTISSTANPNIDFGTQALGGSAVICIGTMTNNGNTAEGIQVKGNNTTPASGNGWTLITNGATPGTDQFGLEIGTSNPLGAPVFTSYSTVTTAQTNLSGLTTNLFGTVLIGSVYADSRCVWGRITMPSSLSGSAAVQSMTVSFYGVATY